MPFVNLMNTRAGRVGRIVAGAALMAVGILIGGVAGMALSILGAVPVLSGLLDICLLGPLFGGSARGARCPMR